MYGARGFLNGGKRRAEGSPSVASTQTGGRGQSGPPRGIHRKLLTGHKEFICPFFLVTSTYRKAAGGTKGRKLSKTKKQRTELWNLDSLAREFGQRKGDSAQTEKKDHIQK
jgi:hypothetical protein